MATTLTRTPTSTATAPRSASTRPLWPTGLAAGLAAAAATVAIAAAAHAVGVSLETAPGQAIPVLGFGQLTLFFTAVGVLIARGIGRRAGQPRSTFVTTTMVLTALSVVPDIALSAEVATKATLVLTHLAAAAIVIPALAGRLPQRGTR
jgi:hypothetical protein